MINVDRSMYIQIIITVHKRYYREELICLPVYYVKSDTILRLWVSTDPETINLLEVGGRKTFLKCLHH